MDGILSGFSFSRKKTSSTQADDHLDTSTTNGGSSAGSDSMRLTKSDPIPDFDNDDISDFGFSGVATPSSERTSGLAQGKQPTAIIGPKITFKGELSGEEDLLIQGTVEGTIDLKGMHLTIGSQGVIKANVSAKTITVEGKVEGDITASEHIAIKSGSRIQGNLKAERVTLEDGAKFRGSIDMDMTEEPAPRTDTKRVSSAPVSSPSFTSSSSLDSKIDSE